MPCDEVEYIKAKFGDDWRDEQMRKFLSPALAEFKGLTTKTIPDWIREERVLPRGSARSGKMNPMKTPYIYGVLEHLHPRSPTRRIVVKKGTQIAFSEIIFSTIGFYASEAPANTMLVLPIDDLIKREFTKRLMPMIEGSDTLSSLIDPAEKRSGKTNKTNIEYPGGSLTMASANSGASLRSANVKVIFCDEVDGYPRSVSGEGDPVQIVMKRLSTHGISAKLMLNSTPTVKGDSRIDDYFEQTNKQYYFIPCPHCYTGKDEELQTLEWNRFYERKDGEVCMSCERCGKDIEEHHKNYFLPLGKWIATEPHRNSVDEVGFHLSSLYSPVGWFSWKDAMRDYKLGQKDETQMQNFVNLTLGDVFEPHSYRPKLSGEPMLYSEKKDVNLPNDALCLTCGLDTQDNRVEGYVYAWTMKQMPMEEGSEKMIDKLIAYAVDFFEIKGDTQGSDAEVWQELHAKLKSLEYKRADGKIMKVDKFAIDEGGHRGREVKIFCAKSQYDFNISPVFGNAGWEDELTTPYKVRPFKYLEGIPLTHYRVRVDPIKSAISKMMSDNRWNYPMKWASGGNVDKRYEEQMSSEKLEKHFINGFPRHKWVKVKHRNEALDCSAYAFAALRIDGEPDWENMKKTRLFVGKEQAKAAKSEDKTDETPQETDEQPPQRRKIRLVNKRYQRGNPRPRR